jgi:indolepyruvate ferredoxin oxidoreductase alpha subunit
MSLDPKQTGRMLLSGNEAIALAALDGGVALGTGYPGTPSTEILENLSALVNAAGRREQARVQWAPNEKVALEVGIGAAFAEVRALVTMKHVGLNVAADPLFTVAYTGVSGALVIVDADDPGMASSQNEQDNRRYAVAAGVPMIEPSDSQEAYDFTLAALELSQSWHTPVILRVTTRVCHSKSIVSRPPQPAAAGRRVHNFVRDVQGRVMIPAYARMAHRKLRARLAELAAWGETCDLNRVHEGGQSLGIIASGIAYLHAREAAPDASVLKIGLSYPLAMEKIRRFVDGVERCIVIEEGDPYLAESIRSEGIEIDSAPAMYRFGELSVGRVRRILAGDASPEAAAPRGKPPQLCVSCPHRVSFELLKELGCIVAGDIGCYTLGVLPPFEAMDTCVCMGASITVGLGLRHVLGPQQAKKVVSVIGDSTFIHSGLTGLAEMVYNPPATGHIVMILDNGTTAMTGLQEHPGTGRSLDHQPANQIVVEDVARAMGVKRVFVVDPVRDRDRLAAVLKESIDTPELTLLIARRPCLLAAGRIKEAGKEPKRVANSE